MLKTAYQLGFVLLLLSAALWIYSSSAKRELPDVSEIDPALMNQPVQQPVRLDPFTFEYMEKRYIVKPLAVYEIWGLVVTHNDISSIADMYHDSSSVDFKDLCVIWGKNLSSNNFHQVKYHSEPWTCFYRPQSRAAWEQFSPNELSNNHLLSRRDEVREVIRNATVGDQIHMKGLLVGYAEESYPQYMRTSSLVRDDTGNGACEVMFVEAARIIKEGNPTWKQVFGFSKSATLWLLVLVPLAWFFHAQAEFKQLKSRSRRQRF